MGKEETKPSKKISPITLIAAIIFVLIIATLLIGVGVYVFNVKKSQDNQQAPDSTTTSNPTSSIPANWLNLESKELGISFRFPALPDKVKYQFNEWPNTNVDPSGTLYAWEVTRTDIDPRGYTYSFAGGASKDMTIGRDRWITDNYRWLQENDKYFVEQSKGYKFEVAPLKVVTRSDSLKSIIFDPNPSFWDKLNGPINLKRVDRVAVLNLPEVYHPKIKSITFYFYDETSLDNIEKVINSVGLKGAE